VRKNVKNQRFYWFNLTCLTIPVSVPVSIFHSFFLCEKLLKTTKVLLVYFNRITNTGTGTGFDFSLIFPYVKKCFKKTKGFTGLFQPVVDAKLTAPCWL